MNYESEILRVLTEAGGEGLSIKKISRHVFNACNSFFAPADYEEVHAYVARYLVAHAQNANSIIEKTDIRGIYRLNMDMPESQQLRLQFFEGDEDNTPQFSEIDQSLPLFDF
ncbi:MAG: hypothetical protein IJM81_02920 [Prevotella sp.]|nr:hypothetical protein [Prevotella sp.]